MIFKCLKKLLFLNVLDSTVCRNFWMYNMSSRMRIFTNSFLMYANKKRMNNYLHDCFWDDIDEIVTMNMKETGIYFEKIEETFSEIHKL